MNRSPETTLATCETPSKSKFRRTSLCYKINVCVGNSFGTYNQESMILNEVKKYGVQDKLRCSRMHLHSLRNNCTHFYVAATPCQIWKEGNCLLYKIMYPLTKETIKRFIAENCVSIKAIGLPLVRYIGYSMGIKVVQNAVNQRHFWSIYCHIVQVC